MEFRLSSADSFKGDVPAGCAVYRILNLDQHIKEDGSPKSSGFSNSSPEEGETVEDCYMSVFLEDEMAAEGKTLADLAEWWGTPAKIFQFSVKQLEDLGEIVRRAPIKEFPGHAAVQRSDRRNRTGGQKRALARAAQVVFG